VEFVRASPDQTLALRLERGNEVIDRWVTPEAVDDAGVEVGRIGAALGDYEFPPDRVRVREYSMLGAWVPAVQKTWAMTRFTVESLVKMIQGLLSPRNLSGPITIAKIAGQTAERGLDTYLGFIALISVSLAVLNLLPVPMLDGGHLLYYAVEALAGRPIPERLQYLGLQVGLVLLVGIMLLAFYNDLLRL
jgi:regulator of sigma E protease